MISSIVGPLQLKPQPLIPTTTKLKETFQKNKLKLEIFKDLKENEKLGKQINSKGEAEYYKVQEYPGLWLSRWWNDEGRLKTIEYLDTDFSDFMKFLDELLKNLDIERHTVVYIGDMLSDLQFSVNSNVEFIFS